MVNDAHYAVVVGIDRYPFIRDLRGPMNDANRFAAWLGDAAGGGLPGQNVHVVKATLPEEALADPYEVVPTTKEINRALQRVNTEIRGRIEDDPDVYDRSRLYFFVAGHGIAPTGGKAALLAADASPQEMGYNLELTRYADWYETNALFREAAFFADCCRNRVNEAPAFGPPFTVDSKTDGAVDVLLAFATSVGTWAYEKTGLDQDPSLTRGYFSVALLEGLHGAAVDEEVGRVTADRLTGYIKRFVREQSEKDGRVVAQTAVVTGSLDPPMLFGPAGMTVRPMRWVVLEPPAGFAGPIVVLDHSLRPLQTVDAAARSRLRLADGFYQAVPSGPPDATVFADEGRFAVQGGDLVVQL
jgi:hypothetical protein